MGSEERPAKIRKLSHGSEGAQSVPVEIQTDISLEDNATATSHAHSHDGSPTPAEPDTQAGENQEREPTAPQTPEATNRQASQPLSKNQLKKLRRRREWEAGRAGRRTKKKEKEKEKKRRRREHRDQEAERRKANGEEPLPLPARPTQTQHVRLPVTIVIDCGFDDKMSDKERVSLGSQVTRSYSDNSRAPFQAHLVVSSWGGAFKDRFDTTLGGNHRNWRGIEFVEEDFVAAAERAGEVMRGSNGGRLDGMFKQYSAEVQSEKATSEDVSTTTEPVSNGVEPPTVDPMDNQKQQEHESRTTSKPSTLTTPLPSPETIYLTSDSPNTLTTLTPYSTYIVGGIVDKNRYKGLCYKLAQDRGVKTARLPIGEFMEMQSRKVLTTNHVVEIMIRWLELGDWGESFVRVIPARKGGMLKRRVVGAGEDDVVVEVDEDGSSDDDEEEEEEDDVPV